MHLIVHLSHVIRVFLTSPFCQNFFWAILVSFFIVCGMIAASNPNTFSGEYTERNNVDDKKDPLA